MRENEDELWEGVQIMAPGEVEHTITPDTPESTEGAAPEVIEDEGLIIAPVEKSTPGVEVPATEDGEPLPSSTPPKTTEPDVQLNKHAALITDMVAAGVINGMEDEEEMKELLATADSATIKTLMEKTVNAGVEAGQDTWKNNFDGAKKRFLEIEDAFNDTDHAIQMAQRLDYLDSVSHDQIKENKDLQKQMYFQHLKAKNFTDAEATEAVQEADEIDKLEAKAIGALPALKQDAASVVENSRKQTVAQQQEAQDKYNEDFKGLMSAIDSKDEFISGLKLNKNSRDKIKANISNPVHKDENGKELTSLMYKQTKNPSEFQMLINYYDTIGLFNLDKDGNFAPNMTKLKTVAKSKAVSELDSVLAQDEDKGLGHGNSGAVSGKTAGLVDFFEGAFGKDK